MNYPERFERAINKLVKAYFNGSLDILNSSCCAAGIICDGRHEWAYLRWEFPHFNREDIATGHEVVKKTGYSKEEILWIEDVAVLSWIRGDSFSVLMAVVDVLCDIEGIEDTEPIKDKFRPKLQEVV